MVADYEEDPKAWSDDYLGVKTNADFIPKGKHLPLGAAEKHFLEAEFDAYPKFKDCSPNIVWAYGKLLLQVTLQKIFEESGMECPNDCFLPFLAARFKKRNDPIDATENQLTRDCIALGWLAVNWGLQVEGNYSKRLRCTMLH